MKEKPAFHLTAGHVALDFANTLDNRPVPEKRLELLPAFDDLVRFGVQSEVLTAVEGEEVLRVTKPQEADAALKRALEFREAVYGVFSALAQGGHPGTGDLSVLNESLREALHHRCVRSEKGELSWGWIGLGQDPGSTIWPIAEAAAELLTSLERTLVRECCETSCRWLFVDRSKSHTRRWCDMKVCGNRTKAKRFQGKGRGSSQLMS